MFDKSIPLPYSNRRYFIDIHGMIYDQTGCPIEPILQDGHLTVKLCWWGGQRSYRVATIMLYLFDLPDFPEHLFDEIIPLYRDGDSGNLHIENLLYRFRTIPLECEDHPGFYYIPMNTTYGLNRDGEIINLVSGKLKSWGITQETKGQEHRNRTSGYLYTRVNTGDGKSRILFQHRAVLMTFTTYEANVGSLTTNHIDGDTKNNALDNLEFVTSTENALHAYASGLQKASGYPVLCKELMEGGSLRRFNSVREAARFYGFPTSQSILDRMRHTPNEVYPDLLLFKLDNGTDWPIIDPNHVRFKGSVRHAICSRNVFTNDIVIHNSVASAVEATGVSQATIYRHARDRTLIPYEGYNFQFYKDVNAWPEHHEYNLIAYKANPHFPTNPILMVDLKGEVIKVFANQSIAAQELKMTPGRLRTSIKLGREEEFKGMRYKLKVHDLREHIKVPQSE